MVSPGTKRTSTISRFILGMIFTLFYTTSIAAPQLVLTTDKTQAELGHPIRVQLYGISLKTTLSDINLESLTPDFGVITDYASGVTQDQRWPGKSVQMLQFKLYPRKTGTVIIPSLQIGKIHSKQQALHILAGKTGIPELRLETDTPYQRQEVIIKFTLKTAKANARLESKSSFKLSDFEMVPLKFLRNPISGGKYLLQTGWALTPLTAGKHNVLLPPVEYSISGGSRKLFYPPPVSINVKSLPAYLPPTIPVGEITVSSQVSPAGLLQTNALSYWNLQLTAKATDVYSLPAVLRQVKTTSELQVFPVTTNRKIQVNQQNVTCLVTHTIPFKSLKSGRLSLPEIQFQYFDPVEGKIILLSYKTKPVFVLSFFWKVLIAILTIVIFVWLLTVTYQYREKWQKRNKKREMALHLLQKPASKEHIKKALRLFCEADTGCTNISLSQWKKYWLKQYQTDDQFEELYKAISNACYSNQDNINLSTLSVQISRLFINRKGIQKITFRTS